MLYMWSSDSTMSTNAKLLSLDVVGGVLALRSLALLSLPSCDWDELSRAERSIGVKVVRYVRWTPCDRVGSRCESTKDVCVIRTSRIVCTWSVRMAWKGDR